MVVRFKKVAFERNIGVGGKRQLKSPWFPQLFAEVGTYGTRVF